MMVIGITGHSNLSDSSVGLVAGEIRDILKPYAEDDLVGITCLAHGADQIFAQAVIDLGGKIAVVIPAGDYADRIPNPESRTRFDGFLSQALAVYEMPFATSGPEAYFAASTELIRRSGILMAVWDGTPPDGKGGTADAVRYAKEQNRDVLVVWPAGAQRS
jgi:predicted Rossmann fold nucleotide-binding protein DprA/Smf involved in DNA uptake